MIAIVSRHPVGDKSHHYQTGENDGCTPLEKALYPHVPNETAMGLTSHNSGGQLFDIGASDQQPQHDCHFGEECRL